MALTLPTKKFFRITGITSGIILVLLIGFHFWFKAHAKALIEDLVESTSKGKVKLKIGKFHFNYFNKKIELENAVFYTTDTLTGSTAYRFNVEKIKLQARAILPILFEKKIVIDSLNLKRPHIEVVRLRVIEKSDKKPAKDVSIPEEMGKVYSSIQDALQILKVKRFQIEDGTFTLINKIIPNQVPMHISNLYFQIDNLQVDSSKLKGQEKILFSDNVAFRSNNQDILFPDGRHRLTFSHFRINLQKKRVEFDSCTIAATRTDSAAASFNVFFDALYLTNIDFDTLYKSEVIKADSVYCINPRFNLEVNASKKKAGNKTPPKLENIIKQLTGDLQLKYVIVTNADFNIKTVKDGRPSTFTFSKNNFEMQGLSVDQEALKPIKVKSFAMAIRNYENFIKDSSYSIQFDSIHFKDDRITLSNFIFHKLQNGKILNTFNMPQFNLQGLSWDDLVFERRLKAEQAIMFSPSIIYTAAASRQKKADRQNIFESLGAVNEYMDLQNLFIQDGTIDLRLKNNLRVQLEKADVSVQSNSLLTSTKLAGIKNSLTSLNFTKGRIQAGNLVIELDNLRYAGADGRFAAGNVHVSNREKKMNISLREVAVQRMIVDEITGSVAANGVNWRNGDVHINSTNSGKKSNTDLSVIELRDVNGANTNFFANTGGKIVSTKLNSVSFTELIKRPGDKLQLQGLDMNGALLVVKDKSMKLSVSGYDITDNKVSAFRDISYKNNSASMEADVSVPSLTVIPHIQPLLNGAIALDAMEMTKPVLRVKVIPKTIPGDETTNNLPTIDIMGLKLIQPSINFSQVTDSGVLSFSWHGERNAGNFLQADELHTNSTGSSDKYQVNNLRFYLTDLLFTDPKGKTFNTGDGKVSAHIKQVKIEQEMGHHAEWEAQIAAIDVKDFRLDSTGRSKASLVIQTGGLNNLHVSSSTITNLQRLAAVNSSFRLNHFTGNYIDSNNRIGWYNADFNRVNNTFSLDSFSVVPALGLDSFLAKKSFQSDYMTVRSGPVSMGPVDLERYIQEKKLGIGTVRVDQFLFTDYKDKGLPFNAGVIKPLPVNMIRKIPFLLSVDTILFTNANIIYTETGEKTKQAGTIPITRMTARLLNLRNFDTGPTDSLSLLATGYLMDTAWIRLKVKESYFDSLSGFLMTAQIERANLAVLNPALIPLVSVKIDSGILDTLSMRAIGREYLSWGEMNMLYHDLKIRVLNNGREPKKRLITALANLIIKNKNSSRTGTVFFVRKRDRSAINYLIKIALSGMGSSVGVQGSKKMMRRYKKELEKRDLPPIDFD